MTEQIRSRAWKRCALLRIFLVQSRIKSDLRFKAISDLSLNVSTTASRKCDLKGEIKQNIGSFNFVCIQSI